MHSNIAIELLKTLSDAEIKRFGEYILSPFFNKSNVLVKLFRILEKHHPGYTSPAITKEKLCKKLYPGKPYNEQNLKNRMAELSEQIKNFLILAGLEKNEVTKKHYYIDELIKRSKFRFAEQATENLLQTLDKNKTFNVDYLLYKLQTVEKKASIHFGEGDKKKKLYKIEIEKGEYLINYLFIYIFHVIHDVLNHLKTSNDKLELNISDEFMKRFDWISFLERLKEANYKHYNLLLIYYCMYMTLIDDDEKHYYNLKSAIFEKFDNYSQTDQFNFIVFLLHTIYNNLALKNPKFYKESFELNKFGLEKNIFVAEKISHFSSRMFWSICNNAMNVNEIDWLENFIKEYAPRLQPEEQNNMYNYAMSKVHMQRKQYENSIECLSKIDYSKITDSYEKAHIRLIYFVSYYELGMDTAVFSSIDSFKHFLSENKEVPDSLRNRLKDTAQSFTIISKAKFDNKPVDYADYKKALEQPLYHKNWVIEKMKEFLEKK